MAILHVPLMDIGDVDLYHRLAYKLDCIKYRNGGKGKPAGLISMFDPGVARSHLGALLKRPDAWIDRRTARSRSDDTLLLEDIRQVIHGLGTYRSRRVWGVLRHQPPGPNVQAANHKRVYRVMRDHGLLLYLCYPQA